MTREYLADWKKKNMDKVVQYQRERRERQRQAALEKVPLNNCICCGVTENLTRDHIFPLGTREGQRRNDYTARLREPVGNLQCLCQKCNSSKSDNSVCQIHGNYLGIWSRLPNLDDVEK